VTVACEPTGHRWRVLDQLAAQRGLALVCVQPLLVYRAREGEDLTFDKSDPKDAVIIARLAAGLHCYEPERADAVWARLRHLGARRLQLTTDATGQVNQVRDLLKCAWPAALQAAGKPFRAATWRAAVTVALDRGCGDLARVRKLGPARFESAVRRELPRWDATRPCLRIIRAVYAALTDGAGVIAHRPGALERAGLAMADWRQMRQIRSAIKEVINKAQ
jgi:transposase